MLHRRQFLKLLAGTALLKPVCAISSQPAQRFISSRTDVNNQHYATVFNADGAILWNIPLPARGHAIEVSPDGRYAVVFARRQGQYMWVLDLQNYSIAHKIPAVSGRRFFGHGVYNADQSIIFTTENNYVGAKGVIGIYDARDNYKRVGEVASHGVGSHALKLLSDDATLVIANGGIHTHPDYPRTKLNLDTMRPNLAYVDSQSGSLLGKYELPAKWYQLSIRHLDINENSQVAIAMQHKGAASEQPPLIALHHGEESLRLLSAPPDIQRRMKNYCGSAAFSADGDTFSISSPRGNIITHWKHDGQYLGHSEQNDASGLASIGSTMWASDGLGNLSAYRSEKSAVTSVHFENSRWDNHLNVIL